MRLNTRVKIIVQERLDCEELEFLTPSPSESQVNGEIPSMYWGYDNYICLLFM
jgi:hypothetical protein